MKKYASPSWSYHDTPDILHPSQQLALHGFHKSVRAHTAPMRTPRAVQSDTPRRIVTLSRPTLTTMLVLIAAYCCFATPSMSTPAISVAPLSSRFASCAALWTTSRFVVVVVRHHRATSSYVVFRRRLHALHYRHAFLSAVVVVFRRTLSSLNDKADHCVLRKW